MSWAPARDPRQDQITQPFLWIILRRPEPRLAVPAERMDQLWPSMRNVILQFTR
jgi:hypothetical protein